MKPPSTTSDGSLAAANSAGSLPDEVIAAWPVITAAMGAGCTA